MIRFWALFLCLLMSFSVLAQQEGRMETDRPDQTECPFIVKKGFMQIEMGFNAHKSLESSEFLLPTSLIKYGIHRRLELRYILIGTKKGGERLSFQSEAIGFKWSLHPGNKWIPRTSIISHYQLANLNRDESERNTLPHSLADVVITCQIDLSRKVGIGYNLGSEFHSNGSVEGIYRIAPNVLIGKRGYAYVEAFGRIPSLDTDHWVDGGIAYYVSDQVKLDASLGRSLTHGNDYYVALGISMRWQIFGKP